MVKYYKTYISHSLLNYAPCTIFYYELVIDGRRPAFYKSFNVSVSRKYGQWASSFEQLSRSRQTSLSVRQFRKSNHAVPCSEMEYKAAFYRVKRRLLKSAKALRA